MDISFVTTEGVLMHSFSDCSGRVFFDVLTGDSLVTNNEGNVTLLVGNQLLNVADSVIDEMQKRGWLSVE